tara:strand:+ start:954 stop:2477 length:1524 start_codon:yes stop_codon:yes gene_type:complete
VRIITKEQSKDIDKISIENYNISQNSLMTAAANGIVSHIEIYSETKNKKPRILVICGKGNNGGDSICVASMLYKKGYDLHVHFLTEKNEIKGLPKIYYEEYVKLSTQVSFGLEIQIFNGFDLLIDGIIGVGFRDELDSNLVDWIKWFNTSGMYIVSVDIPSGLNAENGIASPVAVKANSTITFGYSKIGLHIADGKDYSGEIIVEDIGLPKTVLDDISEIECRLFNPRDIENILFKVPSNTYKQDRGKVLIIAGSAGMTGAAILSTYGALRSGAGVSITVCPSSLNNIFEKYILEGMTFACEDNDKGYLGINNYNAIMEKIDWADSLVIGPGLGLHDETIELITKIINTINKPVVLDADGLTCFSHLKGPLNNIVITPHLGEFSKIINLGKSSIINNFIQIVSEFLKSFDGVALIKHVPSCVARGNKLSFNSTGNPGLSTAGSGDVLSGVIASFIAQKMTKYDACRLASFFHGKAADNLINDKGVRGLIASDLPMEIARLIGEYEAK